MYVFRFEIIHNGHKYVMFEGKYNYTQAAEKCYDDGERRQIAMATDTSTFKVLFNLYLSYWSEGGAISGAFVDGTQGVMNPHFSGWYCVNTGGACPAPIPWHPGQPDGEGHEKCLGIVHDMGVADLLCSEKLMAMCQSD